MPLEPPTIDRQYILDLIADVKQLADQMKIHPRKLIALRNVQIMASKAGISARELDKLLKYELGIDPDTQ